MATLTNEVLTLAEQIKQYHKGNLLEIVNTLGQVNQMDLDGPYLKANDRFSHVSSKVIKLPETGHRRINRGAKKGVSRTAKNIEFIEILENRPYIDTLLLESEDDGGTAARVNQIKIFVEAMAQQKAEDMLYGDNSVDDEVINGFLTRRGALTDNCVTAGGSGSDLMSLLLIEWDQMRCHMIYPKAVPKVGGVNDSMNQALGIMEVDRGLQRIEDEDGNAFDVLESVIRAAFGINLLDERNLQAIRNIETSGTTNNLIESGKMYLLTDAINRLPNFGRNARIYVNRSLKSQFDRWAIDKLNGCTMVQQTTGEHLPAFMNVPIRMMERLRTDESAVS